MKKDQEIFPRSRISYERPIREAINRINHRIIKEILINEATYTYNNFVDDTEKILESNKSYYKDSKPHYFVCKRFYDKFNKYFDKGFLVETGALKIFPKKSK